MVRTRDLQLVVAVAGAALIALGCASMPACPAHGGPEWRQLTSDHFTVRTDLDDAAAREVVQELEETRAGMLSAVWGDAPGPPERVRVIALASTRELSAFTDDLNIQGLWIQTPPFPPTMLTGGFFSSDRSLVLHHELAHHLSRWFLPRQPVWFSEGIATFLETVRYDRTRQRAIVGEVSEERFHTLRYLGMYPPRRLLGEAHPDPENMAQFEASSWLLVHYLINHRAAEFEKMQRRMGAFENPQTAWATELADLEPVELARVLERYASVGNYTVLHIPVPPWKGNIQTQAMSDAEVHGTRALAYAMLKRSRTPADLEDVHGEVVEALNEGPEGALDALAVRYYYELEATDAEPRRQLAQRASAAFPNAALAWMMVADSAGPLDAAKPTALARALAAAPNDAEVQGRMAILRASQKRWDEAVAFSRSAVRLRSVGPQLLAIHVSALVQTGQCREASFFATGLREAAAAKYHGAQVILSHWTELLQHCAHVAAERAQADADAPASTSADPAH